MNFSELTNEVILITRRPELQTLIESAVRAATLKAHQKDFYYKDLVETGIQFSTPNVLSSLDPKDLIPRFRKVKYIREWLYDPSDTVTFGRGGKKFTAIEPMNAKDRYGYFRTDVFYMAGKVIQIRSSTPLSHILFGAYIYPDITPGGYSSWIAEEVPGAIIHEAARQVLMTIGAGEQVQAQAQLVAEAYQLLTINGIPMEGD